MPQKKFNISSLLNYGIPMPSPSLSCAAQPDTPGEITTRMFKAVKKVHTVKNHFKPLITILIAARTPKEIASAMIKARYKILGGKQGVLGAASTKVTLCPDGIGYFQHYKKNGSIYWNPATGVHDIHGAIRQRWAKLGWERSSLGYPTSGETRGKDTKREGFFNHFENGSLYWHPDTGAHMVRGSIRRKYLALGAEESILGYPTTDETRCPDRKGQFNHFQAGSIYWTSKTSAHETHGLIRNYWMQHGWERNPALGYPISDELIPHRRIGYVHPSTIRKPIESLPLDIIRIPDEQPSPTLVALPANIGTFHHISTNISRPTSTTTAMHVYAVPSSETITLAGSSLRPIPGRITIPSAIPNPIAKKIDQSQNRYADFENGLVFWRRGESRAKLLQPSATTKEGSKIAWSGHEIALIAGKKIQHALRNFPGAHIASIHFRGTKSYSFDGAGMHNRSHRLHVNLQGLRRQGMIPIPCHSTVEILVEISLDPLTNSVVGHLTKWKIISSDGNFMGGGSLRRTLHSRLDPVLWQSFSVKKIPTNFQAAIAVLSAKTKADGNVVVFLEP